MTELPLVIVNSQRGGPSTGLPTKTEQSDLYQAVYGRNGDAPMPVIAARSPADVFECAIEACRIAVQYMTPVMLLTDGYIANAAEPWLVPDPDAFERMPAQFLTQKNAGDELLPYKRDERGARPWIKPGTPGLMHRIGGIEKAVDTGHLDYSPGNHQAMTDARRDKIANIRVRDQQVQVGEKRGRLAVVGWGSTYGPIHQAVLRARRKGMDVSHIHVRHVWPLPANLGDLLRGFDKVLVPEMNTGQFKTVLRDQFLIDAQPLTKVSGQPFQIAELEAAIATYFDNIPGDAGGGEIAPNLSQLPNPVSGHDDGTTPRDLRLMHDRDN
jgi:2-oxoglutarate/2-oxoacid ferredoxin oxidoreductase subunit alpha